MWPIVRIAVPEVQPGDAIGTQHAPDLAEHRDQRGHELLRGRLQPDLRILALRPADHATARIAAWPDPVGIGPLGLVVGPLVADLVLAVRIAADPGGGAIVAQAEVRRGGDNALHAVGLKGLQTRQAVADEDQDARMGQNGVHEARFLLVLDDFDSGRRASVGCALGTNPFSSARLTTRRCAGAISSGCWSST